MPEIEVDSAAGEIAHGNVEIRCVFEAHQHLENLGGRIPRPQFHGQDIIRKRRGQRGVALGDHPKLVAPVEAERRRAVFVLHENRVFTVRAIGPEAAERPLESPAVVPIQGEIDAGGCLIYSHELVGARHLERGVIVDRQAPAGAATAHVDQTRIGLLDTGIERGRIVDRQSHMGSGNHIGIHGRRHKRERTHRRTHNPL